MFKFIVTFFAKRTLHKMLSGKHKFRSLARLHAAIGRSPEATKELLYAIGARPSLRNDRKWGLVARVGSGYRTRRQSTFA